MGKSIQRKDAPDKVRGTVKFTTDYISPDMLYAKLVTSSYAHAKIKSVDVSRVHEIPGVKAIVTSAHCPSNVGVILEDHPILA